MNASQASESNQPTEAQPILHSEPQKESPEDVSELSAPQSDVEPETTATAARLHSKKAGAARGKRSYNTVDPSKRSQLIHLVHTEQKTIKEAANRLKINYSTAKHIIKSKKPLETTTPSVIDTAQVNTEQSLAEKLPARIDIQTLERKMKAFAEPAPSLGASLLSSSLAGGPHKTFNSSLLSASASLGQSLSLCHQIPTSVASNPLNIDVPSRATAKIPNICLPPALTSSTGSTQAAWLGQSGPISSAEKVINHLYIEPVTHFLCI